MATMADFKAPIDNEIWNLRKTAFLCSDKFSAGSVLKSYDWAAEMKRQGNCVMSGFHSKLEKDVFEILLKGDSPLIWVLAAGDPEHIFEKYKSHVEAGRLLIIPPPEGSRRYNWLKRHEYAHARNKFVVDNADEVVFAHIRKGGKLERLALREGVPVRVLDREDRVDA
jgi:hypothetical protein